jgi:membrane-associated phospholipid phosphatase
MLHARRRCFLTAALWHVLLCACSTAPRFGAGAADQPSPIDWERIGRAARKAALAPQTWAPVAGALALQIGDADTKLQGYATNQTPLFGSQGRADRISDDLKLAANALWVGTALAPAPGDEDGRWFGNKARLIAVQTGAHMMTSVSVGYLKDETKRMRPNEQGATSFPSDHAARSALHTTMTLRNVQALGWSGSAVSATQVGLTSLSAATAWARIEAKQHYPSDVLAGMALGHFLGAFFTDALLGGHDAGRLQVLFEPARERAMLMVRLSY